MIGFSQKIWINHTTLPRGSAELSDTCHAAITSKRVAKDRPKIGFTFTAENETTAENES